MLHSLMAPEGAGGFCCFDELHYVLWAEENSGLLTRSARKARQAETDQNGSSDSALQDVRKSTLDQGLQDKSSAT